MGVNTPFIVYICLVLMLIDYIYVGYAILMNGQIPLTGVLSHPYDILIKAFVPILSDMQRKVSSYHSFTQHCIYSICAHVFEQM